ncbi:MAG TPA: LacI family DNA-binding transcriptional regulator [Terriglobales bacterium]|nr:LacI family DNA-binding transcriptional regulator [Terriglobales bacterium]
MRRDAKKVTMRQIAAGARVSVGTVSHVINNTAGVREAVRRRVQKAIDRLGYQPSLLARGLRRNQTTIIGVIIPDISNPFFPQVVRGIEDVAYQKSYRLMLCNTDNDAAKERVYFDELRAYRMAGLIVIPSADSQLAKIEQGSRSTGTPVICVDRRAPNWQGDTITVDNVHGAYEATRVLIDAGHSLLATITGPLHVLNARERLKGFKIALREAGLTPKATYIMEGEFDRQSGYQKALLLLQSPRPPTAIFAANDLIALGVLSALRLLELRCPQDLSLVGFDDLEIAAFTNPALTTVAQPGYDMGAQAASLLFERLNGRARPSQHIVMKAVLANRESVGPPPQRS